VTPSVFVADLEDSIAPANKLTARHDVSEFVRALPAQTSGAALVPWIVRVNALNSGLFEADLDAVMCDRIVGVSVGKVSTAAELRAIERAVAVREQALRLPANSIRVLPWLETARGVLEAGAICAAAERSAGVAFGMDDYLADVGLCIDESDERDKATEHARRCVSLAAAAFQLPAYESPFIRFQDDAGLRQYARRAKLLGFSGQFSIHPSQVSTIDSVFAASAAELQKAADIVKQYETAEQQQLGSTSLQAGGAMMIDRPVYLRAKRLIDNSNSSGGRRQ
jgi:citrate lyase subunit beta/citryl-CoA lyase